DIMLKDFLMCKIKEFSKGTDFVISNGFFVNFDLTERIPMKLQKDFDAFEHVITWEQNIVTNSILFKRKFLIKKKLFDLKLSRGQETEMFSRLFFKQEKQSYEVIIEPLFLYRQHNETITSETTKYNKKYRESQA